MPDDILISKNSYEMIANLSPLEFEKIANSFKDNNSDLKSNSHSKQTIITKNIENKTSFFQKYLLLDSFRSKFENKSILLANNYGIKLISQNIYRL